MSWMNESDIEEALIRFRPYPNRYRAAKIISQLRDETNRCSDGWHSWPKPSRAATKLMEICNLLPIWRMQPIQDVSDAELKKALAPLKSFYTRVGYKAGMKFPEIE